MLDAAFHPLSRHGPDTLVQIELGPARANHLFSARGGQYQKLKSARDHVRLLANPGQEGRDLPIGERSVMDDLLDFLRTRKQLFEVTLPARRIVSRPVTSDGRPR